MDTNKTIWDIHSNNDTLFLTKGVIGLGWSAMGNLEDIEPTRDAFKKRYDAAFPNSKPMSIAVSTGMVYRFFHDMKEGDYVVYPSKSDRMINIGVVTGAYFYDPEYAGTHFDYAHQRKVKWLKHLPRTAFSQGALYEFAAARSLFTIKNYADEVMAALDPGYKPSADIDDDSEDVTIGATADEIQQATVDFILKTLSRDLKGYRLEDFVADLLNAMGYRTTVSKQGGDRGIDIVAYKDELPPRILVQVKSKDGSVSESAIQSLKGAMREGDYGLFVTLSSYSKNAQDYLNSAPIIRGIDGPALADLVLKYYDKMSEKYQRLLPLKMVYIPVSLEEE